MRSTCCSRTSGSDDYPMPGVRGVLREQSFKCCCCYVQAGDCSHATWGSVLIGVGTTLCICYLIHNFSNNTAADILWFCTAIGGTFVFSLGLFLLMCIPVVRFLTYVIHERDISIYPVTAESQVGRRFVRPQPSVPSATEPPLEGRLVSVQPRIHPIASKSRVGGRFVRSQPARIVQATELLSLSGPSNKPPALGVNDVDLRNLSVPAESMTRLMPHQFRIKTEEMSHQFTTQSEEMPRQCKIHSEEILVEESCFSVAEGQAPPASQPTAGSSVLHHSNSMRGSSVRSAERKVFLRRSFSFCSGLGNNGSLERGSSFVTSGPPVKETVISNKTLTFLPVTEVISPSKNEALFCKDLTPGVSTLATWRNSVSYDESTT